MGQSFRSTPWCRSGAPLLHAFNSKLCENEGFPMSIDKDCGSTSCKTAWAPGAGLAQGHPRLRQQQPTCRQKPSLTPSSRPSAELQEMRRPRVRGNVKRGLWSGARPSAPPALAHLQIQNLGEAKEDEGSIML